MREGAPGAPIWSRRAEETTYERDGSVKTFSDAGAALKKTIMDRQIERGGAIPTNQDCGKYWELYFDPLYPAQD